MPAGACGHGYRSIPPREEPDLRQAPRAAGASGGAGPQGAAEGRQTDAQPKRSFLPLRGIVEKKEEKKKKENQDPNDGRQRLSPARGRTA